MRMWRAGITKGRVDSNAPFASSTVSQKSQSIANRRAAFDKSSEGLNGLVK